MCGMCEDIIYIIVNNFRDKNTYITAAVVIIFTASSTLLEVRSHLGDSGKKKK